MSLSNTYLLMPTTVSRAAITQGWLKTALLFALGAYFIWIIASGALTNYISVRFAWLSYVAAALFILLGAFSAWQLRRSASTRGDGMHAPLTWTALGIIAIPLVLGTLIPSQPLGADAVDSVSMNAASANLSAETFTVAPEQRNVLDWLRVFNNATDPTAHNGEPADVIGFVYTEPNMEENTFMAARFTISCCVADANAIGLPVVWSSATPLVQGEWVRVRGQIQAGEFRGEPSPLLRAESVEVVEQPQHPYLYP